MTTIALSLKSKSFLKSNLLADAVKLFKAIPQELAIQRAIAELHGLSDRQLADLGIARGDIEKRVRGL